MYMLHQFEEHGYDLLGRPYHFQVFMCDTLGFANHLTACPANESFIFVVNVGTVWIASLAAAVAGPQRAMIGACAYAVPLVNGFAHIIPAIFQGRYNPGLLTSIVLFEPVSWWVMWVFYKQGYLNAPRVVVAILSGVALHAVMIGSLIAAMRGLIDQEVLLAVQLALASLPIGVGLFVGTLHPHVYTRSFATEAAT
jgi:hypothetical protein